MKKYLCILLCVALTPCRAQETVTDSDIARYADVVDRYEQELDKLVQQRDSSDEAFQKHPEQTKLNPYIYRLITPAVYYGRSTHQMMGLDWSQETDGVYQQSPSLNVTEATDYALANLYAHNPSLVSWTESTLMSQTAIRQDVKAPVEVVEPKLSDKAVTVDLISDIPDTVAIIAKKPNFWKYSGSTSLQFTQSYFSENWYQGGENNYAGIASLTLNANYDNKRKVQWDNKLEAQLGFQTTNSDNYHKFRVTSNLLRITSKLGYKAAKNWFYTGQVMSYTQLAPYYEKNQRDWKASFATPLYLTVSVGMDFKYKTKNGKVDLSVYMSPLAYYMTYVSKLHSNNLRDEANPDAGYFYTYPTTYGLKHADDHFLHKFGPNLTVNSKIKVMKNITWTSRFYWFSNFHSTLFEWENTLDFTINKYFSAKFYAYPRFDDSSRNYRKNHGYLMFKEWLSLGLNYNF